MKIYKTIGNAQINPGIVSKIGCGPCFMNDAIIMGKNIINDKGKVGKKECGYNIENDYEINLGKEFFDVSEVEIYQVIFDRFYTTQ